LPTDGSCVSALHLPLPSLLARRLLRFVPVAPQPLKRFACQALLLVRRTRRAQWIRRGFLHAGRLRNDNWCSKCMSSRRRGLTDARKYPGRRKNGAPRMFPLCDRRRLPGLIRRPINQLNDEQKIQPRLHQPPRPKGVAVYIGALDALGVTLALRGGAG
jgi:hypothetical protein